MRKTIIIALLTLLPTVLLADAYDDAMTAYERQDYRQALSLFSDLADADDPYAQYMLGRLYAAGNGTPQDFIEAHKWFNLAAARGHRHATEARDAVAENMNSRQIGRAQRLAGEWQPGSGSSSGNRRPGAAPDRGDENDADRDSGRGGPDLVAEVQQALNNLGYNAGPVDGQMGRKTTDAIRNYQSDNNLPVDGEPSRRLLRHMRDHTQAAVSDERDGNDPVRPPQQDSERAPQRQILLSDSFRDGDYTRNPGWEVSAGRFDVDPRAGLVTVQQAAQQQTTGSTEQQLLNLVIGTVLEQATGQRPGSQPDYAEIHTPLRIDNSFALELQISSHRDNGHLEFGPYQSGLDSGYRLVYSGNNLALVRLSRAGSSVIESSRRPVSLEGGQVHTVQWTRDSNADMVVAVDGRPLLQMNDRGFNDAFSGFSLVNRGGDYAIRSVVIQSLE
jgi:peptidoglycan hydrolase-like protein with peptidoglycan-binding domain